MDKATQGAPKWPTLDKTKASLTEPVQKEKKEKKIKDNAVPLIYCFHEHKGEHNRQSKTELKKRTRERVEMSPPASILAWISGSCPLRVRVCWVQLETGAQSPVWSLKAVSRMASICCSLITAVSDGGNVPKYGTGELSS